MDGVIKDLFYGERPGINAYQKRNRDRLFTAADKLAQQYLADGKSIPEIGRLLREAQTDLGLEIPENN